MKNKIKKHPIICITVLGLASFAAQACPADNAYIGAVCVVAGAVCPDGTLVANGQTLQVTQNSALFKVIGTKFGGDGVTNFNLPDLRGRSLIGSSKDLPLGITRGQETTQLTGAHIPSLDRDITFKVSSEDGAIDPANDTYLAGQTNKGAKFYVKQAASSPLVTIKGVQLGNPSPEALNILPPQIALNFCVVVKGQVPPKPETTKVAR